MSPAPSAARGMGAGDVSRCLKNIGIDWKGLPSLAGDRDTPKVIELTWDAWELVFA